LKRVPFANFQPEYIVIMANVREIEMETLQIPNSVKEMLLYIEGKSIKDKLVRLIMSDLENRFRSCTERLYEYWFD